MRSGVLLPKRYDWHTKERVLLDFPGILMHDDVLALGRHITILPVIHGSGDFAVEVRRRLLAGNFDCVAVPLPRSFQKQVEQAIEYLPTPSLVVQPELQRYDAAWSADNDAEAEFEEELDRLHEELEEMLDDGADDALTDELAEAFDDEPLTDDDESALGDGPRTCSYVPIDPCQPVIAALRAAREERIPRAFIDLETDTFQPYGTLAPDAYALRRVALERFAAAMLPVITRPESPQRQARIVHMAQRLHELERRFKNIVFVCSVLDWPWIREAYLEQTPPLADDESVEEPTTYQAENRSLAFLLGELPYITGLYERARAELEDDENLTIDGVKELLISARETYQAEFKSRSRKITPHMLRTCLKYIRNLSLVERRLSPDLYTIVVAAQQIAGDQFALHVVETARSYPYQMETPFPMLKMGIEKGRLPDGEIVDLVSRLPGSPVTWKSIELKQRPHKLDREKWQMRWNPFSQCSWPPEDQAIETFRTHVFQKARAILGADLARTEKFTTSVQDGIDIRDTLRNWHSGDIYVKIEPPARGRLDCAVMIFDSPADPRDYPYRTTWFSEFEWESTLAFYATDFRKEPVGPGICLATYGGAMFLYPPVQFPDIWTDRAFDFTATLEERLLAAACTYSSSKQIALLAPLPPGAGWRKLARKYGKQFVHVPTGQFGAAALQQLRLFHVLNGRQVRSYASDFIRKA
jgi:hypothetical protein